MNALMGSCVAAISFVVMVISSCAHATQEFVVANEAELTLALNTINEGADDVYEVSFAENIDLTQDLPAINVSKHISFLGEQRVLSGGEFFKALTVASGVSPFIYLNGLQMVASPKVDLQSAIAVFEPDVSLQVDKIVARSGQLVVEPDFDDIKTFGNDGIVEFQGACALLYFSQSADDVKHIVNDIMFTPIEGESPKGLIVSFVREEPEVEHVGVLTLSGDITGEGALIIESQDSAAEGGTVRLAGDNSYTFGTKLKSGRLQLWESSGVGSGILRLFSGAVLEQVAFNGTNTLGNAIFLDCAAGGGCDRDVEIAVNGADTVLTLSGDIQDGTGSAPVGLHKSGTGMLKLSGNNQFSGGVVLTQGAIELLSDAALGVGDVELAHGVILRLKPNGNQLDIVNNINFALASSAQHTAVDVQVFEGDALFSGELAVASNDEPLEVFYKSGEGALHISAANQDLSGEIVIAEGALVLDGAQASLGAATVAISEGAVLAFDGHGYIMNASNQITLNGTSDDQPSIKLMQDAVVEIVAKITGTGNLYIAGDAVTVPEHDALLVHLLNPENNYSGGKTVLAAAQLEVHAGALGASELELKDNSVVRWGDPFALVDNAVTVEDDVYLDPNGLNVVAPLLQGVADSVNYLANSQKDGYVTFWQDVANLVPNTHFILAAGDSVDLTADQVLSFVRGSNSPNTFKRVTGGTVSVESASADDLYQLDFDANSEIQGANVVVSGGAHITISDSAAQSTELVNLGLQEQSQLILSIASGHTVLVTGEFSLGKGVTYTQLDGGTCNIISDHTVQLASGSELLIENGDFSANSVVAELDGELPAQIINDAAGSIEVLALSVSGEGQLDVINKRAVEEDLSFLSLLEVAVNGATLKMQPVIEASRIDVQDLTLSEATLLKAGEGKLVVENLISQTSAQLDIANGLLEVGAIQGDAFERAGEGAFTIKQDAQIGSFNNISGQTAFAGALQIGGLSISAGEVTVADDLSIADGGTISGQLLVGGTLASSGSVTCQADAEVVAAAVNIEDGSINLAGALASPHITIASGGALSINLGGMVDAQQVVIESGGLLQAGASLPLFSQNMLAPLAATGSGGVTGSVQQLGELEALMPLTIDGDLVQGRTAVTAVHVNKQQIGTIRVLGKASLDGVLMIHSEQCQAPAGIAKLPILIADGGIAGGFVGQGFVSEECSEFFRVVSDSGSVFLINIAAVNFADSACSCVQRCMLQALTDYYVEHTPGPLRDFIEDVLVPLPETASACAWKALMGEPYVDLLPLGIYTARLTTSAIQKQLWRAHDLWLQADTDRHVWADGFVQHWKQSAAECSVISGWRGIGSSFDIGGDYRGRHGLLGLAVNIQRSHANITDLDARLHYSNYGASLYGSVLSNDLYIDGKLGGGYTRSNVRRTVCIHDYRECLTGVLHGGRVQGRAEMGLIRHHYGGGVQPFVVLEGEWVGVGSYDEDCDSPIALRSCSSLSEVAMYAEAGVRLFSVWHKSGWILQPEADLRYAYNFKGGPYRANIGWRQVDSCCCFDGLRAVRNIATLTLGAVAQVGEALQIALRGNGQLGSEKWQSVGANLQVSYAF